MYCYQAITGIFYQQCLGERERTKLKRETISMITKKSTLTQSMRIHLREDVTAGESPSLQLKIGNGDF